MPRIPVVDLNYAEVGRWILDYWQDESFANQLEENIKKKVEDAYSHASKGEKPEVKVVFDTAQSLTIVVPYNPWSDHGDDLAIVRELDSYQRELGMVVFGGCR